MAAQRGVMWGNCTGVVWCCAGAVLVTGVASHHDHALSRECRHFATADCLTLQSTQYNQVSNIVFSYQLWGLGLAGWMS